jgi:hypothetical protein
MSVVAEFSEVGGADKDTTKQAEEFTPSEEPFGVVAVPNGRLRTRPVHQRFATSYQVRRDGPPYSEVLAEIRSGERTIDVGGLRFLILVCGEINILRNIQADQAEPNRVVLRHERGRQPPREITGLDYDILFNPAHEVFSPPLLGKMFKRWACLSRRRTPERGRLVIHTANVGPESARRAAIYGFRNGALQPCLRVTGDWRGGWVLEVIDFPDPPFARGEA